MTDRDLTEREYRERLYANDLRIMFSTIVCDDRARIAVPSGPVTASLRRRLATAIRNHRRCLYGYNPRGSAPDDESPRQRGEALYASYRDLQERLRDANGAMERARTAVVCHIELAELEMQLRNAASAVGRLRRAYAVRRRVVGRGDGKPGIERLLPVLDRTLGHRDWRNGIIHQGRGEQGKASAERAR